MYTVFNLKFNVHGSVHRNNILIYKSQQDAQVTEFILSDNCSTCFRRHHHLKHIEQLSDKINSVICASFWNLYIRILFSMFQGH